MKTLGFEAAEILLPDFSEIDGTRWSVIACDQFTSEPEYWKGVEDTVGNAPSTLRMILPEAYLSEAKERIPAINDTMREAEKTILRSYPGAMIYVERIQSDGPLRRGIVGAVDLEQYDYRKGSDSLIRATEGTVLERIPPRVAIRRGAVLELPHVMLLIDDPERSVIEPLGKTAGEASPLYDFDLMAGGGHIRGTLIGKDEQERILSALSALILPEERKKKYGTADLAPLLFAVGDGNHSLASAKATYEEIKAQIGAEAALRHPARMALVEVVNLHEEGLRFEPIYRVVSGCDPAGLIAELRAEAARLSGSAAPQKIVCVTGDKETDLTVPAPQQQLTVGTLQAFLDRYQGEHPEISVDYIHGETSLRTLAARKGCVGFLFEGMRKDELFRTVMMDGALPRKTFSMGHAQDKRYYLECHKIR